MKKNNMWRYHPFTRVQKVVIIRHTVPEIWHVTNVIVIFHFGLFFASYNPKNQNFKQMKKKKNAGRYHNFTHMYQKL